MDTASVENLPMVRTGDASIAVAPPEEISEAARPIWDTLLPDLISMGVFTVGDTFLLFELCETLASAQSFRREAATLQAQLAEADRRVKDALESHDAEKVSAAFEFSEAVSTRLKRARAGYLQSMKLVLSIAGEFGISPVARLRLGLMKLQGNSLLGALANEEED